MLPATARRCGNEAHVGGCCPRRGGGWWGGGRSGVGGEVRGERGGRAGGARGTLVSCGRRGAGRSVTRRPAVGWSCRPMLRRAARGVGIGLDAGEAVRVGDGYRGSARTRARLCALAGRRSDRPMRWSLADGRGLRYVSRARAREGIPSRSERSSHGATDPPAVSARCVRVDDGGWRSWRGEWGDRHRRDAVAWAWMAPTRRAERPHGRLADR